MLINPKEGNNTTVRMGNSDFEGQGSITVELQPMRFSTSLCSTLEEVNSTFGSGRRWWAVLSEGHLRLYKHYGAPKERHSINTKDISKVVVHKSSKASGILAPQVEVRTSEKTWLFEHNDLSLCVRWAVKLKNCMSHFERPGGTRRASNMHSEYPRFMHDRNGELTQVDMVRVDSPSPPAAASPMSMSMSMGMGMGMDDDSSRSTTPKPARKSALRKNSARNMLDMARKNSAKNLIKASASLSSLKKKA
jgi:hypothetical protein